MTTHGRGPSQRGTSATCEEGAGPHLDGEHAEGVKVGEGEGQGDRLGQQLRQAVEHDPGSGRQADVEGSGGSTRSRGGCRR